MTTAEGEVTHTPIYVGIRMLEGTGFVNAAVPAPTPLVGYMLLQALGFKVDLVNERIEKRPDDEIGPPIMLRLIHNGENYMTLPIEPFDDSKLHEPILSREKTENSDGPAKKHSLLNLRQYDYTIAYDDYAIGYKEAADQLIAGMGVGQSHGSYLAYPLMFLYRHYLELRLKEIVIGLKELWSLSDDFYRFNLWPQLPDGQPRGHCLTYFWDSMLAHWFGAIEEELVAGIVLEELESKYDIIGERINELDEIDRSSEVFRYPVDKKGSPHHISTPNLGELSRVKDVVDAIAYHLDTISRLVYESKEQFKESYEDAVYSYYDDLHADYLVCQWKDAR